MLRYTLQYYRFAFVAILLTTANISCKKFVTIDPPNNQLELSKIFSNDQAAVSAAIGLYYRMNLNSLTIANGGATVYAGLSADEIINVSPDTELDRFRENSLIADNGAGVYSNLWKASYQAIYHTNAVLEGLANSPRLSNLIKQQLKGEMLVGRAFHYLYLVNLFGDVPLVTTTNYDINAVMSRTAAVEVYQQIIKDLTDAENLLVAEYPSEERARPNKYTASALLARVYLFNGDWVKAETKATEVINAGTYSLEMDLSKTFFKNSNETIWQLKPGMSFMNTAEGVEFNPFDTFTVPKFSLTASLFNEFENADQRKTSWVAFNNAAGQPIYYPYKYKVGFSSVLKEYYVVVRLAELYLIRAEANAQQNNISAAVSDLNIIRNKSSLPNTTASTVSTILSAIEHERRVELFAEWGHRWLDLKRTNRVNQILAVEKGANWQPTDALYPIPIGQIQTNPTLIQNPGY